MTGTHGPVDSEYVKQMHAVARLIDNVFNAGPKSRRTGFMLLVFPFGDAGSGRINYLSNGERADCIVAMKELLARFEGRHPEETQTGMPETPQ